MKWESFKKKFHKSWHKEIRSFIESKECDNIYNVLKNNKENIIYPKAINTFKNFMTPNLDDVCVAVFFREPYSDIEPDGIPLSCFLNNKIHPMLNMWYNAIEKEFYGLNLHVNKHLTLEYILKQGIFLHNVDVTVQKDKPGSHKNLWKPFTLHIIKSLTKRNIPIVFVGKDLANRFPIAKNHPMFIINDSIHDVKLVWDIKGKLLELNKYIYDKTYFNEPQWVDLGVPF